MQLRNRKVWLNDTSCIPILFKILSCSLNNVKDKFISILFLTYFLKFLIVCYIKQIASVASRERADTAYPVL